jgi:hypothetical protein
MKKNTVAAASVYHLTSDMRCAYVNVGNVQITFQNGVSQLTSAVFAAVAAHDRQTFKEIEIATLTRPEMEATTNALKTYLSDLEGAPKPRKLTFAQVQRIYSRAVD